MSIYFDFQSSTWLIEKLFFSTTCVIVGKRNNQEDTSVSMTREMLAGMIDHTLLKENATEKQIDKICEEAIENKFMSVCINPGYVEQCVKKLKGTDVKVCTVIGFPLGATTTAVKVFEAKNALENGAVEIDMVVNVGKLKSQNWDFVKNDIGAVAAAVKGKGLLKVIIETCLLTDEEKIKVCQIAKKMGADFVKTSTGFSTGGATVADVALMKKTVGKDMGVKASGGIHTTKEALEMIKAGASRIGASAGIRIIKGL